MLYMYHFLVVYSSLHIVFFVYFQVTVAFDETTTLDDVDKLFKVFAGGKPVSIT